MKKIILFSILGIGPLLILGYWRFGYCAGVSCETELSVKEISPQAVFAKIQRGDSFFLIDVREDSELAETGTLPGAIHIPLGQIDAETMAENNISKDADLVVYCRSGRRSGLAQDVLIQAGFENVKNLSGGILRWKQDAFDLVTWEL
jgi:rhodanese-related sulfurtransferase